MEVNHFKSRNLILKESTKEDFIELNIEEVNISPDFVMPSLPQSFSIRNEMTDVEDQGSLGSCTAFCVVACLEHMHRRDLSEGQVNHEAEKKYGDCDEGLAVVHAYEICKNPGAIDESLWPYDDTKVCWSPPPNIGGTRRYKFNQIGYIYHRRRANIIEEIKTKKTPSTPNLRLSLNIQRQLFGRRKAISVSVPVVWPAWPWTGDITMPSPAVFEKSLELMSPPNTSGWHCITICGWDNTTGRFLFKNSWGEPWGDSGYGTIPYQYIDLYSDIAMVGW